MSSIERALANNGNATSNETVQQHCMAVNAWLSAAEQAVKAKCCVVQKPAHPHTPAGNALPVALLPILSKDLP